MRLVPYMFAAAILALRLRGGTAAPLAGMIAAAGLAFVLVRTAGTTASLWLYDRTYQAELAALDHVPQGARLISFVGTQCRNSWETTRLEHLPGMAVVRREAFSNDQWRMPGAALVDPHYAPAGQFGYNPSQIIELRPCTDNHWRTAEQALTSFPRQAFDYLWLIDPPPVRAGVLNGLEPIWSNGRSALYRILHPRAQPPRRQPQVSAPDDHRTCPQGLMGSTPEPRTAETPEAESFDRDKRPVVAVFRAPLFNASETFVRAQAPG